MEGGLVFAPDALFFSVSRGRRASIPMTGRFGVLIFHERQNFPDELRECGFFLGEDMIGAVEFQKSSAGNSCSYLSPATHRHHCVAANVRDKCWNPDPSQLIFYVCASECLVQMRRVPGGDGSSL